MFVQILVLNDVRGKLERWWAAVDGAVLAWCSDWNPTASSL